MALSQSLETSSFSTIEVLQLNGMLLPWSQLSYILPSFPCLTHLELALNKLNHLREDNRHASPTVHENLRYLNLSDNELDSWGSCMTGLLSFPRMQRLILSSNRISSIDTPPSSPRPILSISALSLSGNLVKSWVDIDHLAIWFPSLCSLHFANNPLATDSSDPTSFARLLIARLPLLTKLNGTEISRNERVDAERYYMVQIEKEHSPLSDAEKAFLHRRWFELCKKHGRPDQVEVQVKSSRLLSRLISVNILLVDEPPIPTTWQEILQSREQRNIKQ